MPNRDHHDSLPDVADVLTHRERVVPWCLKELQQERGGRQVPTGMLYGSVVEYLDMSVEEMQSILVRSSDIHSARKGWYALRVKMGAGREGRGQPTVRQWTASRNCPHKRSPMPASW